MHTGPEVGGCKPVLGLKKYFPKIHFNLFNLATFEEYKDREEVLRKSGMLRGSNISVTEDMSR